MPQFDIGLKTFLAAGTIAKNVRVKLTSTAAAGSLEKVKVSGASGADIGISQYAAATGDKLAVKMFTAGGTWKVKLGAATVPTYGTDLYRAAAGELTNHQATGATACYVAVQTAAATNEIIEVIPKVLEVTP